MRTFRIQSFAEISEFYKMNAVISLCHFCEIHGPSIVMCTQVFHETSNCPTNIVGCRAEPKQFYGNPDYLGEGEKLREEDESVPCRACHSLDNSQLVGKDSNGRWIILNTSTEPGNSCGAERRSGICYLSNDHERRITYISRRVPSHPRLRRLLRQACVLSLSCEVSEGREGPVSFSVPSEGGTCSVCRRSVACGSGQALSHTFLLKDSHARGFHRWFSIVIVMRDHVYLLNSWPFLVESLSRLISSLQSRADKVYEKEQAEQPQRALRLLAAAKAPTVSAAPTRVQSPKRNENKEKDDPKSVELNGNLLPQDTAQPIYNSAASSHSSSTNPSSLGPARSLTELTNDPMIFAQLHNWFVWILKAGASRLSEKLVDSLPTKCVSFDFDQHQDAVRAATNDAHKLVQVTVHYNPYHMAKETEEGFTLISSREDGFASILESLEGNVENGVRDGTVQGKEANERSSRLFSSLSISSSTLQDISEESEHHLNFYPEAAGCDWKSDVFYDEDGKSFLWSPEDGNSVDIASILPDSAPEALCRLRSALGGPNFLSLLHAFLTGSQVVLRGSPIKLLYCIAKALKFLVPKKCFQPVYNSEEYLSPSKSNLLVLGPHVAVPSLAASSGLYPDLKDMMPSSSTSTSLPSSTPSVFRIDVIPADASKEVGDYALGYWGGYRLVAKRGNISTSPKYPTLIVKIDKAIDNSALGPNALYCHLISLKEEWINIAEVVSRVKRSRRYFSKGPFLGEFGSAVDEEAILLKSLGGQEQDWPLIWFWIYGFKKN